MASIINASSTGSGGIVQTADASGILQLQSNGSVVVAINSATQVSIATANTGGALTTSTTAGNWGVLIYDGTNNASMLQFRNNAGSAAGNISLSSAGATSLLISSVAGVNFPATQVASADANTLDDYEEGSFTVSCYGGTVTGTPATATGSYIKVGKLVYARWSLDGFNRPSGASGDVYIGGLPFTIDASNTSFSHNPIGLFINGTGTGTAYNRGAQSLRDISSGGTILRVQTENSTTADVTNVQISNLGTTYNYLRCDFVYQTSS
jgi:hypothetical protein